MSPKAESHLSFHLVNVKFFYENLENAYGF